MAVDRGFIAEAFLAALACLVFLGCLGSLELWGKREQRLAAESLDTVQNDRWLVARIQGRPRLEKPPLPRWTIAGLAKLVGRCDETVVRIPGAIAALGTVALTYLIGRRLGGRSLGFAAATFLATAPLFIAEARQAGQDVPVAFFTTLALYAALQNLDDGAVATRRWAVLFHVALGLGFLCKGPVILAIVAAGLVPWGAATGRMRRLAHLAFDPAAAPVSLALAASWPLAVWSSDPNAAGVWLAEMGQKTGALGISHRERSSFLLQWPVMLAPWMVAGGAGLLLPFRRRDGVEPWEWLAWSWAVAPAVLIGCMAVAKPNYYIPCLPGFALLAGAGWLRLDRRAFGERLRPARLLVDAQWMVLILLGAALVISASWLEVPRSAWCVTMAGAVVVAGALGMIGCRRGWGMWALSPALGATALAVLIGYGLLAPEANPKRGHREVARAIDFAVPAEVNGLSFLHELDEGLWFYLRGRRLVPVPGSQPQYNDGFDQMTSLSGETLVARSRKLLAEWLHNDSSAGAYLLVRDKVYDVLHADFAGSTSVLFREPAANRNTLVLLRVNSRPVRTAEAALDQPTR